MRIELQTKYDRTALLKKVQDNRAAHQQIVDEARVGYLAKAQAALTERQKAVQDATEDSTLKLPNLVFPVLPPQNHLDEYDTLIAMLDMSREDLVTLEADEFLKFVMDEWEWTDQFLSMNAMYSSNSMSLARAKGLL